jgi:hypothetical protein
VLFARRHISVFSIGDRVTHSYFQNVGPRCNFYFLGLVRDLLRLTGLHAVDEYHRADRRADDNQFSRIGYMGFAMKPATTRDAKQQDNKERFQWSTFAHRKQAAYHAVFITWERRLRPEVDGSWSNFAGSV